MKFVVDYELKLFAVILPCDPNVSNYSDRLDADVFCCSVFSLLKTRAPIQRANLTSSTTSAARKVVRALLMQEIARPMKIASGLFYASTSSRVPLVKMRPRVLAAVPVCVAVVCALPLEKSGCADVLSSHYGVDICFRNVLLNFKRLEPERANLAFVRLRRTLG